MARPAVVATAFTVALLLPLSSTGGASTAHAANRDSASWLSQTAQPAFTIDGWVVGPHGNDLDNVDVTARDHDTSDVVSSAKTYGGEYELYVDAGTYDLRYEHDGLVTVYKSVTITKDKSLADVQMFYPAPIATTAPTLSGPSAVGGVLQVKPGAWDRPGLAYSYAWKRDGAPIAGAHRTTYQVKPRDVAHKLSATVTAAKWGYLDGAASSKTAKVAKGRWPVGWAMKSKSTHVGHRMRFTVAMKAPKWAIPTGTVTMKQGKRTLVTLTLRHGKAKGRLPKLTRGRHRVVAHYSGSASFRRATSSVKVVKVVR